ncbi:tetratricopeptide repeat protein [Chloroflexi bacterium CFX2]|nr:tetratricopeptide repeat protein [Chloroflexi bacterium CFX2]
MEYASARATPELVGRDEILGIIGKAVEAKSKQTHVIYITAKGGMGKTRLLEEVVKRWKGGSRSKKRPNLLVVNQLIDLYHTHTHNEEGLIAEIVEALDPKRKFFKTYAQKRAVLTRTKYEKGETVPIQGLRREMFDAFLEDLNELGKQYDKVVLVFDTAEVLTYETDRVQTALGLADQPIGVARWLTQDFISRLRNAVVVIAGRPEGAYKLLEAELNKTGAKLILHPLPGFNEKETLEYFKVIAKAARTESPQSAKRIESIPEETRRIIHGLTQGEPFVLALLIDYLAIANEIPFLEPREPEVFREELRDLIVEAIQEGWRPLDQVVEALSWMPKGTGAESLAWVLHDRQPTEDEVNEAQELIYALREPEKRLSFVKIRAADDLVFLQDEMYTLMEKVHISPTAIPQRSRLSKDIDDFYDWKLRQTRWKIEEIEEKSQIVGNIPRERLSRPGKRSIEPEVDKVRKARARLQAYQVEQVYYKLRSGQLKGFELYLQYAEESFQSRDLNLFLLLRDEILRFKEDVEKGKLQLAKELTLEDIEADLGIRWIKVSLADEKYEEAEKQMIRFRETCPDLLPPGSYADLNLKLWETWMLVNSGKDHQRAQGLLKEILEKAETLPSETSLDRWHISFLKAYGTSLQGFLYRVQGEFQKAVEKYLQAVPLWRELKLEAEASNNLNNLALAEAEAGDFQTALVHCEDGLHMRRRLGRPYLIGLSLNTLGLIETKEGSPERARFRCEQALRIFRQIENGNGIGLACLAYAEALRRMTNADLLTHTEAIEHLKEAARNAEEAVKIFTEQVKQPLRLAEAYIELGCDYREWARHLPDDDRERAEKVEKSRAAYEAAVAVADERGYEYRAIDALVNMAWLYYYDGDAETARKTLRARVKIRFENEHLYTREHGVDRRRPPTSWNWVQLGKANLLLGMIYFDEYKQADKMKKKDESEQRLRQAAHNWTLSMAYNNLYGKDFRDFAKSRKQVYEKLEQLNVKEMEWVKDSMNQTHHEYHIAEEERAFEQFLQERFGFAS